MRLQRWSLLKGFRVSLEIPQAHQAPCVRFLPRNFKFIPRDMERRALPSAGGFDLDQPLAAVRVVATDVISSSVTILVRNPAHTLGQTSSTKTN